MGFVPRRDPQYQEIEIPPPDKDYMAQHPPPRPEKKTVTLIDEPATIRSKLQLCHSSASRNDPLSVKLAENYH